MSRLKRSAAIGAAAVVLVAGFEGLRTSAYFDPIGVLTICYGETKGVRVGDRKTPAQCRTMLTERLDVFASGIERCLRDPASVPDGAYVASVSLAYNIGIAGYCGSSVRRLLDAGAIAQACDAFRKFTLAGGVKLPGLVKRREAERRVCLKGVP